MSGRGRAATRLHGRGFDLLATVLIGVIVVGAALVPAVTANSGETVTIRGDVSIDGERLPFFPVGFWSQENGTATRSRTDANGVFTMDVPIALDGYAFAGTEPDADTAVLASAGRNVVRGTIGGTVADPVDSPLYQGWPSATARRLDGGAERLHFRLQEAGRAGGTAPIPVDQVRALQVRRLDGSVVQTVELDAQGRWRSRLLAPGRYAVTVVPRAPMLPVATLVDVPADRVVEAVLPTPAPGATIDGLVETLGDGSVGRGIPVLLSQDGDVVAATETGADGRYRFDGLAAGDYDVDVGRFASEQPEPPTPAAVRVPLPGETPTPSPTATLPTPSATPDPSAEAVEPLGRTSDEVLPGATAVTVPATLGEVDVLTVVSSAGVLTGQVSGADGAPVQVVVEDQEGRVLRAVDAAADGSYSVGGMERGDLYTIWAVTRPEDPTLARMGTTSAVATEPGDPVAFAVAIDRPAAVLQGTVVDADEGTVTVGDAVALLRTAEVDRSGAYVVQGLVPGLHPVVVDTGDRLVADPVAVGVVEDGGPQDLRPGPLPAVYRGWFLSGGAGVPMVSGTATSTTGAQVRFADAEEGRLEIGGLRPGTYTYDADSFSGTVPVVDGPWWFDAPEGSFALSDDATTDVGPVLLHVRAR